MARRVAMLEQGLHAALVDDRELHRSWRRRGQKPVQGRLVPSRQAGVLGRQHVQRRELALRAAGPLPPVPPAACVLVSTGTHATPGAWADVYRGRAGADRELDSKRGPSFRTRVRRFIGLRTEEDEG